MKPWHALPTRLGPIALTALLFCLGVIMDHNAAYANAPVANRTVEIDGLNIFYRESGAPDAPVILLLHGFPSSSHMFRNLLPALGNRFHVIAPDYPGFGFSDFPPRSRFDYTFAGYARLMQKFTERIGARRYALYVQDYGAPVGLRLALLAPDRVTALIVQNGNAYEEGLSAAWDPLKAYWRNPSELNRAQLRAWLTADGIRQQYVAGLAPEDALRIAPETWTLDWALLNRPGVIDVQLDLFGDYASNVALYPAFQAFLRKHAPPTLIVWGKSDPFFTVAGARAYQRDVPNAELHLLDAGHFALETQCPQIATLMQTFLDRHLRSDRS